MARRMEKLEPWRTLLDRLSGGIVLRHALGLRHPVAAGYYCPMHEHAALEIVFHPTGRGVTRVRQKTKEGEALQELVFEEGDVVVYAPQARHDQRMEAGGEDVCVQIMLPSRPLLAGGLHAGRIEDAVLRGELELLARGEHQSTPGRRAALDLRATAVLVQVMEQALRSHEAAGEGEGAGEYHVRKAERYVQVNYANIGSVLEVAEVVGLGGDHMRHLFRQRRGRTLVGYLNEVRIARAKVLLAHAPLTLKEIAAQCGWLDEYYFSAVFTRACGMPPGKYREINRPSVEAQARQT